MVNYFQHRLPMRYGIAAMVVAIALASSLMALAIVRSQTDDNVEPRPLTESGAATPLEEPASEDAALYQGVGSGGGGAPLPPHLLATYNTLPPYPGAKTYVEPRSDGPDLSAAFWAREEPQAVMDFYLRQLTARGWSVENPPTRTEETRKADVVRGGGLTATFVKNNIRLTVGAESNTKDPISGATQLAFRLESLQ